LRDARNVGHRCASAAPVVARLWNAGADAARAPQRKLLPAERIDLYFIELSEACRALEAALAECEPDAGHALARARAAAAASLPKIAELRMAA
jgi:hypothetical protein